MRVVTSAMHNVMTRSAIAFAAAALACGCGDDGSVSVEIESVQATPSALGIGQTAKLQWSIDPRAHLDLLHWVTLFPGHVENPAPDAPDGIAAVGQTEGTFLCTYTVENELVCVDEMDPHDGGLVIAIAKGGMHKQELTLRACILGIDGEGDKHGSCKYESITLTLTTL